MLDRAYDAIQSYHRDAPTANPHPRGQYSPSFFFFFSFADTLSLAGASLSGGDRDARRLASPRVAPSLCPSMLSYATRDLSVHFHVDPISRPSGPTRGARRSVSPGLRNHPLIPRLSPPTKELIHSRPLPRRPPASTRATLSPSLANFAEGHGTGCSPDPVRLDSSFVGGWEEDDPPARIGI